MTPFMRPQPSAYCLCGTSVGLPCQATLLRGEKLALMHSFKTVPYPLNGLSNNNVVTCDVNVRIEGGMAVNMRRVDVVLA